MLLPIRCHIVRQTVTSQLNRTCCLLVFVIVHRIAHNARHDMATFCPIGCVHLHKLQPTTTKIKYNTHLKCSNANSIRALIVDMNDDSVYAVRLWTQPMFQYELMCVPKRLYRCFSPHFCLRLKFVKFNDSNTKSCWYRIVENRSKKPIESIDNWMISSVWLVFVCIILILWKIIFFWYLDYFFSSLEDHKREKENEK